MLPTLKERGSYIKPLKNEAAHICDNYGFYIKYHDNIKITVRWQTKDTATII